MAIDFKEAGKKILKSVFVIKDVHNFADYYDKTLVAWHKNFVDNWDNLIKIRGDKYNKKFKRIWEYYLQSSAGAFRAGNLQLWQIILTKEGFNVDYESVR